jgi:hypothetical protein
VPLLLSGCGGGDDAAGFQEDAQSAAIAVVSYGPNAVSYWNEVASNTITVPAAAAGTREEQRPILQVDLATVHVAIYDAVIAIAGAHQPFAVEPTAPAAGASMEAAAGAAAYRVLSTLFPNRAAKYQGAYDLFVAALPDGEATQRGLALGDEVGRKVVAWRGDDGRGVALAPFVPGGAPGDFRGLNPINRFLPSVKPFSIGGAAQFRADPPPALDSAEYAEDFDETKAKGALDSSARSAEQTELARFHTETPAIFLSRNFRQFATSQPTLAENARLAAQLWVTQADSAIGCFESKYHYLRWRPSSAITLADTDGNPATVPDPTWTPVVPTPNHPEYPAAHSCTFGALAETLSDFYGTKKLRFTFDSTVTGTTRTYDSTDALIGESTAARIYGGMHFRTSTVRGAVLGGKTAQWVQRHYFGLGDSSPKRRSPLGEVALATD